METLHLEESIIINRPLKTVFDYADDINNEVHWQPWLREWSQSPEGQKQVGTELRYVNYHGGRDFTNIYRIIHYEPYKQVRYISSPESAIQASGGIHYEVISDSATQFTLAFSPQPGDFWEPIPLPLVTAIYRNNLTATLDMLKAILEHQT